MPTLMRRSVRTGPVGSGALGRRQPSRGDLPPQAIAPRARSSEAGARRRRASPASDRRQARTPLPADRPHRQHAPSATKGERARAGIRSRWMLDLGRRGTMVQVSVELADATRVTGRGPEPSQPQEPRRARLRPRPWPGRWAPIPGRPYSGLALGKDAPLALPNHAGTGASDQLRGAVSLPPKRARAPGASRLSLLVRGGTAPPIRARLS
jgi:hypothetical protein